MRIIKFIIYILISITLLCETQEELKGIFGFDKKESVKYSKIDKYEADLLEKTFVFRKLIVEKNIEKLNYIKSLDGEFFNNNFITSLIRFDDLELYNFYRKEIFFEEEKLGKIFLLEALVSLNGVNIFSHILEKVDKNVRDNFIERAFSFNREDILEVILGNMKINKEELDISFLESEEIESEKCIEKILEYPYKENIDNQLLSYYINIKKIDKVKELIEKRKISELDSRRLADLINFSLEMDDEFFNAIINKFNVETFNFSEGGEVEISHEKLLTHMLIFNNQKIKKILIDDGYDLDDEIEDVIKDIIRNDENDKLEKILKSGYKINFEKKDYDDENWVIDEVLNSNNIEVFNLLKKYVEVKKIQITVSNLSKIIESKNIYVMNFIIENNLGEKIFSEDEDFFIRNYGNNNQINKYVELLDYIGINEIKFLDKNLKDGKIKKNFINNMFKIALMKGDIKTAEYLLEKGVNINEQDCLGRSPIYYVIKINLDRNYYNASESEVIDFMIANKADLNKVEGDKSALMIEQDEELLVKMLEKGIDLEYKDKNGYTAYDYAFQNKNIEFIKSYNKLVKGEDDSE